MKDKLVAAVNALGDSHTAEQNLIKDGVEEIKDTAKKVVAKAKSKPAEKADSKKTEKAAKVEEKVESKPEPKVEPKPEPVAQAKPEPVAEKPEPIPLGKKQGLLVIRNDADQRLEIVMPNRYDATYDLAGKGKPGYVIDYMKSEDPNQKVQNTVIAIPYTNLANQSQIDDVNRRISHARNVNTAIESDIEKVDMTIRFALSDEKNPKTIISQGAAKVRVEDQDGKPVWQHGGRFKGDVIAVGQYFVALVDQNRYGLKDDEVIVRKIETNKFLDFQKGDYDPRVDRLERVKERLHLTADDFSNGPDQMKPNVGRYMAFDPSGRVEKINFAYVKEKAAEATKTQDKAKSQDQGLAK